MDGLPASRVVLLEEDVDRLPVAACGTLRWEALKRGSLVGIRVRDLESDAVTGFSGIQRFDPDTAFVVIGKLEKQDGLKVPVTNVLGQTSEEVSPGRVSFSLLGRHFSIIALDGGEENKLFLPFADATSGITTYHAGRFLYAKVRPGTDEVAIDFNRAYNPPCAFTGYATCPLPPRDNLLPVAVMAGEMTYGPTGAE